VIEQGEVFERQRWRCADAAEYRDFLGRCGCGFYTAEAYRRIARHSGDEGFLRARARGVIKNVRTAAHWLQAYRGPGSR